MFDVNILMVDTGQKVASNWNPTEHDIMSNDWEIAGWVCLYVQNVAV